MTQQAVKLVQRGYEKGQDILLAVGGSDRDDYLTHEDVDIEVSGGMITISIDDDKEGDIPIQCVGNASWDIDP